MKLSRLAAFLEGRAVAAEFSEELYSELAEHRHGLRIRGGSAPVMVTEDADVFITPERIKRLCKSFLADEISPEMLAYTADVLQLADRVSWHEDWIADVVAEFTDPEVNGAFTKARAEEI